MGRPPTCLCGRCQKCKHREYMREWYAAHPGYATTQARKHADRIRDYERRKYGTDPDFRARKAARNAVGQKIRRGQMERGKCEVCGSTDTQAHHEDYGKPFDVRWLCDLHHRSLHGEWSAVAKADEGEA